MNDRTSEWQAEVGRVGSLPLVLHVIPTPAARGAQREARALADHLDDPAVRAHRVLGLYSGPPDVRTDFSLEHVGRGLPGVGFDPRLVRRLRAALGDLDPVAVVAHGSEPLKYLVPAMWGRRRPLAYYAIGTYSGSGSRLQLRMWRHLVSRSDAVLAEGAEVRQECITRLGVPPSRVTLAPNGRDPDEFHPPLRPTEAAEPLVMFVGALTEGKRPERFVETIAGLRSRGVRVRAVLIGDGPLRPAVEGPASAAGVELLGGRGDVAEQMRRADVLVFTSKAAGEGMPGVLIEAGLSGLPVVATAAPGVHSIVEHGKTGLVVDVDDLPGLFAATGMLLDDPELRATMGGEARRRCMDRYSLVAVGARWMSVLGPLVDAHHSDGGRA